MRRAAFILSLFVAAVAVAQTTAPSDLAATVAQLDDRDPDVRAAARSALMSLTRNDLPRLRDAVAGSAPDVTRRAALREAVLHVYLTGKHNFAARVAAGGFIGVKPIGTRGEPPTIRSRTPGYDAFRALRNGDTIVAIRVTDAAGFVAVPSIEGLADTLQPVPAGRWVTLRILRDGRPEQVPVRVAPVPLWVRDSVGENPAAPEAEAYWQREFAPALDAPATAPTTRPA